MRRGLWALAAAAGALLAAPGATAAADDDPGYSVADAELVLLAQTEPALNQALKEYDGALGRMTDPDEARALKSERDAWAQRKNFRAYATTAMERLDGETRRRLHEAQKAYEFDLYRKAMALLPRIDERSGALMRRQDFDAASKEKARRKDFVKAYCIEPMELRFKEGQVYSQAPGFYSRLGNLGGSITLRVTRVSGPRVEVYATLKTTEMTYGHDLTFDFTDSTSFPKVIKRSGSDKVTYKSVLLPYADDSDVNPRGVSVQVEADFTTGLANFLGLPDDKRDGSLTLAPDFP